MSRLHSTLIALVIGGAAAAGLFAAVHTVRLGQTVAATRPAGSTARQIAQREAKLARWSRSLDAALAKHPPALPKLPHYAPVPAAAPATGAVAAAPPAQPRVTYVQPPPVVRYRHAPPSTTTTTTGWSDDSGSDDNGSGSDDGSGDGSGGGDG